MNVINGKLRPQPKSVINARLSPARLDLFALTIYLHNYLRALALAIIIIATQHESHGSNNSINVAICIDNYNKFILNEQTFFLQLCRLAGK